MNSVVNDMSNMFVNIIDSDEFREEFFVAESQARLAKMMDDKGISRAELARKLNVSRARVTQIFSDEASNLTLRLLARSFLALEEEPMIISKSEYEALTKATVRIDSSRTSSSRHDTHNQLGAALIAELLKSHGDLGKMDVDKPQRRAEHTRDWAAAGPNIIPLRGAANG